MVYENEDDLPFLILGENVDLPYLLHAKTCWKQKFTSQRELFDMSHVWHVKTMPALRQGFVFKQTFSFLFCPLFGASWLNAAQYQLLCSIDLSPTPWAFLCLAFLPSSRKDSRRTLLKLPFLTFLWRFFSKTNSKSQKMSCSIHSVFHWISSYSENNLSFVDYLQWSWTHKFIILSDFESSIIINLLNFLE